MILASMINFDENALECDLAETYNIYEYRELPLKKVALFSVGLRNDSRIKLKINKTEFSFETLLLASITDKLSCIIWQKSKDGEKGKNKPSFLIDKLLNNGETSENISFNSIEEFENKRNEILMKGG